MQGYGKLDSKIWLIADSPKRSDTNGPLTSSGGRLFLEHLRQSGIGLLDVRIEYLVAEMPPQGKFDYFREHKPDLLYTQVKALKDRIRECSPNLVFCVGSEPLYYLMGQRDIMKWRGHVVFSDVLGCKTMATINPEQARRQHFVEAKNKPGQYEALMFADIEKAVEECQTKELPHAKFDLIVKPDFWETKTRLEHILKRGEYVGYDIEVIKPYHAYFMDCIGFSCSRDWAICVPLYKVYGQESVKPYFENPLEQYEIFRLIKAVMESDIPKVAQNSQFDTGILEQYYGIKTRNLYWDTMVAAHCLYCDLPKDLGTLISLYTHLPYHKYLIGTGGMMDRWEYNAADALANIHIMFGEIEEMKEMGCYDHYKNISHPAIRTCIALQMKGVKVDEELRSGALRQLDRRIAGMDVGLKKLFEKNPLDKKKGFNPSSPQQKSTLFYDMLGCKGVYVNRKLTANKDAVSSFLKDDREIVRLLADVCLHYKEDAYLASKLRVSTTVGRMHCKYDVTGTDTGRLNSTESELFGTGTNLQNLEKGVQRRMLVPDPGHEFIICDLHSAEAYLVALMAQEKEQIEMLKRGEKVYTWLQQELFKRYPHLEGTYSYKQAKQSVHSMNYGAKPRNIQISSGLPMDVAQRMYELYHTRFPGIEVRMHTIEQQITKYKTLRSMLGRQRVFFQKKDYKLLNMAYAWITQSTIGEVTIVAMTYLHRITEKHLAGDKELPYVMPLLNTHDGLVVQIPKDTREIATEYVKRAFHVPLKVGNYKMSVPIEIGFADNFNDMKEEKVYSYE
jgi:DNA polymerase I-like protein with 3'-5' exonuclease and polymerase domains